MAKRNFWACAVGASVLAIAGGCASYRGTSQPVDPATLARQPGWIRVRDMPQIRQQGSKDCGAASLSSVLAYWGHPVRPSDVERELIRPSSRGFLAGDLAEFATRRGFEAFVFHGSLDDLAYELRQGRPAIVGVAKPYDSGKSLAHYEVVIGYNPEAGKVLTFDPAQGLRENSVSGFLKEWEPTRRVLLVLFERDVWHTRAR